MEAKLSPAGSNKNPNPSLIPTEPQTSFYQISKGPPPDSDSKLVITGGSKLSGHVTISGSKNAALPILAATLCCTGLSKLENVPNVSDTRAMISILGSLGAEVEFSHNSVVVNTDRVGSVEPDPDLIGQIRGGFFVVGPLLGRFGEAVVSLPGGCDIGARPVDIYIAGLRALGAVVEVRDNKIVAHAANGKGLVGREFRLDYPSVGATETLMMAACMAQGHTLLANVAQEPEIIDLACFLTKTGANIEGAGTDTIRIHGKSRLLGSEYRIMPDRIETGTFMIAAAITRSRISMSPVFPGYLSILIDKLSRAGCKITHDNDILEISAVDDELAGFVITTQPYPGFPTDLQPQIMALLSTCNGLSIVEESVFENRMTHVRELQKLGAKIKIYGNTAFIYGNDNGNLLKDFDDIIKVMMRQPYQHDVIKVFPKLRGTRVVAGDLRGGMSLVLGGLAAEGVTQVNGISHIDRGYENFEKKLQLLGAHLIRL